MTDKAMNSGEGQSTLKVDEAKRATLKKLVGTAAFAVPVVASFKMSGLMITKAQAQYYSPTPLRS